MRSTGRPMLALGPMFLLISGCICNPRIVEKPVPVEIEKVVTATFPIPEPCTKIELPASPPPWSTLLEFIVEYDGELKKCSDKLEAVRKRMDEAVK